MNAILIVAERFRVAYNRGGITPLLRALRLAALDLIFDFRYGVDTAALWSSWRIPEGYDSAKYSQYGPTKIGSVKKVLSDFKTEFSESTFVDIGSGKGRMLLLASHLPFRKIIGVEFHPKLHEIAQRNIRRYGSPLQRCHDIEVHCADATRFTLPDGKLVLYLYNPFGAEMVTKFLENLWESLCKQPREVWIIYHSPVNCALMMECGFLEQVKTEEDLMVFCHMPSSAARELHEETSLRNTSEKGTRAGTACLKRD